MENDDLHSYILDLEKSLALNKQVLSDLIYNKIPKNESGDIIFQLMQEIQNCEEDYLKIVSDCEDNQAKALIDEQIASEYQRKENEFISESEEKLSDLIYQNDKKNKIISELSIGIRQLEEDTELYKKSKHMIIVPPSEDFIDLHCKVEEVKRVLTYEARRLYMLQSKKERLIDNSGMLQKEMEKNKVLLKNPMNRKIGIEHSNSNLKADFSMEIVQNGLSDDESEEMPSLSLPIPAAKTNSQPLFEFSLSRQRTLSFDVQSIIKCEEDEKAAKEIDDYIEIIKMEIQRITEQLVKITKENEILLENNERLARNYLKTHDFIDPSDNDEAKMIASSKRTRSNSNLNDEVFKFIDINQLTPRLDN